MHGYRVLPSIRGYANETGNLSVHHLTLLGLAVYDRTAAESGIDLAAIERHTAGLDREPSKPTLSRRLVPPSRLPAGARIT